MILDLSEGPDLCFGFGDGARCGSSFCRGSCLSIGLNIRDMPSPAASLEASLEKTGDCTVIVLK